MASGLITCPRCGNVTQPSYCPTCDEISRRRRTIGRKVAVLSLSVFVASALIWFVLHLLIGEGSGSHDATSQDNQIRSGIDRDQASGAIEAKQRVESAVQRLQDQDSAAQGVTVYADLNF